jgi:hypothetical protein
MKKIILMALLAFISTQSFAQKKKEGLQKKTILAGSTAGNLALAKLDNLKVEIKTGNFQVAIADKDNATAAIIIKPVEASFKPLECKLSAFKSNGSVLYLLTWVEKSATKTDLKTEEVVSNYSCILEVPNKKQVFSNTETTTHITEKVFLDKGKNASETQEKLRREGYHFVLNPDGSILLKNKTSEKTLVYDAAKMEYLPKKK